MEEFNQDAVKMCLFALSKAEDPSDAALAWAILQRKHPDLSAMVALGRYDKAIIPQSVKKYIGKPHSYLVPYFSSEKIYFLDDELLTGMFSSGEFQFRIDYSVMFDTNIATYIDKLVRGESLGNVQSKVVSLVDDILHDDLNFDHLFYMTENVKNVLPIIERDPSSKLQFWKSLNRGFRNNLVSLQIFRSINCQEYKRTCNPRPEFSFRQAARYAIDFTYDFYASEVGKDHVLNFVLLQRLILLQLIGMVKIQLSSGKSAKHKMGQFFSYIHEVVGAYFDREAIIAHKYFCDRNAIEMLERIKKGGGKRGLLKKLDNIAWDMAAPRFMERLIVAGGDGRYFIPMFLTFDSGLRELLGHYAVKGAVFNKTTGAYAPIPAINTREYFAQHGCQDEIDHLYSEPVRTERLSREKPTRFTIHRLIRREFKALRALI
ncbi:MAG: hypothetical protein O9318_03680 [Hylemonella sp.]|uniref:hypothetical protein n=1 Tax=Hylemonella sp. TaxID=2066020 RepID=UPI0022BFCBBD|nr:hypothetical protein [Hylemonella sp.]MCZ8251551.1 hypothetical protein [Hylemonella sp.]